MALGGFLETSVGKLRKNPFLSISISFIIGIILKHNLIEAGPKTYILSIPICLLLVVFFKKLPQILIIILFILVGMFRLTVENQINADNIKNIVPKLGPQKVIIEASIIAEPEIKMNKSKILIAVEKLENMHVNGKILLFTKGKTLLQYGDKIKFSASLQEPRKNNNPFAFNYKAYLERKKIYCTSYIYDNSQIQIINSEKDLYYHLIITPRKWLRKKIYQIYDKRKAGFLAAVILGEKYNLPEDLKTDFANSGLSHILAVSGLHTGVIALIILSLMQIVLKNRNLVRIITIFILIYYIFLSHSAASVQRAVVMISLFLIGRMTQRHINNINILFTAAFIILIINPNQLFSIGFQFSFLSVFSILVILPVIEKLIRPVRKRSTCLFWLINMIAVSLIVQLMLAPLTSFYFSKVAFGGMLANILAIPLISIILPLTFLTLLLPFPLIIQFYAASAKLLIEILFSISNFISETRFLLLDFVYIDQWQAYASIILIGIITLFWNIGENSRNKLYFLLTSFIIFFALFFLPQSFSEKQLQITVLDVKTGDAIFIKTPSNKNILIDTGNKTDKNNFAKQVIIPFLKHKETRHLDLLVLTHPHADHIGGARYLLERIKVDEILLPQCSYGSQIYLDLLNYMKKKKFKKTYADTSIVFANFPGVKIKLLSPYLGYKSENINNLSVVLKLIYKDFSCLLSGDAEKEVESWLVETYSSKLDIDFLKLGHHGSRTASTEPFILESSPEYGVISVGKHNRFGLPNQDVIERMENKGVILFRTDEDGAILFSTDGNKLKVRTILSGKEITDSSI